MTQPAAEQLLNLADRAERGLTPDEAQRLREGLTHHCARAEEAERRLTNLRSSYKTALGMFSRAADRAIENGKRADRAEQLATDLRTQAITEQKRAERVEAAIERVRDYATNMRDWDGDNPAIARWATDILDALDEQQEQPASDRIDCEQQCTVPDGVQLIEVPRPRHAWGDVFNCPNAGCGKSFLARRTVHPEPADD